MYNPIKKLIFPIVSRVRCTNCTKASIILTNTLTTFGAAQGLRD